MKRILPLLLAFALLLPAFCRPADAAGSKTDALPTLSQQVTEEAAQSYLDSQLSAGRESFHGYCGLMVSHQLFNLGINKYLVVNDGRDQFDYYAQRKKTNNGYSITPYYAEKYDLKNALNAVSNYGTRDVRNILVGFEWTNTEAGGQYGHSLIINGIIGGKVYFTESFDCYINGKSNPEGSVVSCSIDAFAEYFEKWTVFDGLIHFGAGSYEEVCPMQHTSVYLRVRFDAVLRTLPCVVGERKCQVLRQVKAGERLYAMALYRGDRGLYYQVQTPDGYGYIAATSVSFIEPEPEDITLTALQLPQTMEPGQDITLSGTVASRLGKLTAVEICVYNEAGIRSARARVVVEGAQMELAPLKKALKLDKLSRGVYTVEIYGEADYPIAEGTEAVVYYARKLLSRQLLQIDSFRSGAKLNHVHALPKEATPEGWVRKNGCWYFYENGSPKVGWMTEMGIRYYFGTDGVMATGWQSIGNGLRFFSPEGAMMTDLELTYGKTLYQLDQNGVAWAKGEVKSKGKK